MREKARSFIYLNAQGYLSFNDIIKGRRRVISCFILMVITAFFIMITDGLSWRSSLPLVFIAGWSLLYQGFILMLKCKRFKKTFPMRFLINGIWGLLASSLNWCGLTSVFLYMNGITLKFCLWLLPYYLMFSIVYIILIVIGIHTGIFGSVHGKRGYRASRAVIGAIACILPTIGVYHHVSALFFKYGSILMQDNTYINRNTFLFILLAFFFNIITPALAHINFVKYFYCKIFNVFCDENGETSSPNLNEQIVIKPKSRVRFIIKLVLGVLLAPVLILLLAVIIDLLGQKIVTPPLILLGSVIATHTIFENNSTLSDTEAMRFYFR